MATAPWRSIFSKQKQCDVNVVQGVCNASVQNVKSVTLTESDKTVSVVKPRFVQQLWRNFHGIFRTSPLVIRGGKFYICVQFFSKGACFVRKPAHFEFQSYRGALHTATNVLVEKYILVIFSLFRSLSIKKREDWFVHYR